jgi:hypothetical protein
MAEKALATVAEEGSVQGVSTRSVDELVQAVGTTGIPKVPHATVGRRLALCLALMPPT